MLRFLSKSVVKLLICHTGFHVCYQVLNDVTGFFSSLVLILAII